MRKQWYWNLLACLLYAATAMAQSETGAAGSQQSVFPKFDPKVLPPSPDAYQFTRYGNLPVGLSTGTVQYAVPVYTIQAGSLQHAISLNYATNGVRVDEMPTRVGINWSLKAGGMITRTVMDKADDNPGVQPTAFHGLVATGYDASFSESAPFYDYVKQASIASPPDFEPDIYSFSIDGYAGKFSRRENGEFRLFNANGCRIQKNGSGFVITSPEGTQYFFYATETAKAVSYPLSQELTEMPAGAITAWYLTKILSVNRDSIVFHYGTITGDVNNPFSYKNGVSQNYGIATLRNKYLSMKGLGLDPGPKAVGPNCMNPAAPGIMTSINLTETTPRYLTSIEFKSGRVDFVYTAREDVTGELKLDSIKITRTTDNSLLKAFRMQYTYTNAAPGAYDVYVVNDNYNTSNPETRKRLFLTQVQELSADLLLANTQSFVYDDPGGLPPRFSFSQDRYGFYNGKVNTFFFPNDTWLDWWLGGRQLGGDRSYSFAHARKGTLQKIVYPTGGYTQFEYEPHQTEAPYQYIHHKDQTKYALLDTSTTSNQEAYSDTFFYNADRRIRLYGNCSWASHAMATTNGSGGSVDFEDQYYISIYVIDVASGNCAYYCGSTLQVGQEFSDVLNFGDYVPAGHTYRLKIVASRPHLKARVTAEWNWDEADRSPSSGIAGVRIKSITDFARPGKETNRRRFLYTDWADSTHSSGTGVDPFNPLRDVSMTRLINAGPSQTDNYYCGYNTIHSSSVLSNYVTDNNTVYYRKVIELHAAGNGANNGGTEYEFLYRPKNASRTLSNTWPDYVWGALPELPAGTAYENNDFETGSTSRTATFTYTQFRGARTLLQETLQYYSVDTATLVKDSVIVAKHERKRDFTGYSSQANTWPYFTDYRIYRYDLYFGFLKQDSAITRVYTGSQVQTARTTMAYSLKTYRPSFLQTQNSNGKASKVLRSYVGDIVSSNPDYTTLYGPMIQANQLSGVLSETSYRDNQELLKQRMQYAYQAAPVSLYLPVAAYRSLTGNPEEAELNFEQYDAKGHLLQFTGRDGVTQAVLYGYDSTYPVAKISGSSYSNAVTVSGINLNILNNPPSDAALRTELNKLRTNLGSQVQVTTLTYQPLVGVTSQTDASGKTIYYTYDAFNRLQLVRDQDNNILKKYCYNLQGQQTACTETLVLPEDPSACSPANCTGNDKKCINGVCETGSKKYLGSYQDSNNNWFCIYYYRFSDGSVNGNFTEPSPGPCLIELE
jgi:YD repeat-containing protein